MLLKQQRQLIATGLVTQEQISEAMKDNEEKKAGLLLNLLNVPDIDGGKLLLALAKIYKVPFIDPTLVEVEPLLLEKCPEALCEEICFVPIALNAGEMVIATADPMD
ncbi:MAG: pilus assembly protein PilB, partial [Ghiorsea sp.]|nr:pilus assembly protein PilB [Ghiorsea sp.]